MENLLLYRKQKGFTLIEILVVIGIIAILATIVIIAINPARQFAQSRNAQRTSNIEAILNAVGQNIADSKGILPGAIPAGTATPAQKEIADSGANLCGILIPTYMSALVVDPLNGSPIEAAGCSGTYNTGYTIEHDANNRITVCAPKAATAFEPALAGSTAICITR